MRPVRKPLPGPVASEAMQMSSAELRRIVLTADHNDGAHASIREPLCPLCVEHRR